MFTFIFIVTKFIKKLFEGDVNQMNFLKNFLSILIVFTILFHDHNGMQANAIARELFECSKICAGAIGAACLFGIINDQVTARVCPEYFTQGFHRRAIKRQNGWIFRQLKQTNSPTKLGLIWGIIATWWMGALLSVPLVLTARIGSKHKISMQNMIKPTIATLGFMGACSAAAGFLGYRAARAEQDFSKKISIKLPFCKFILPSKEDFWTFIASGTPKDKINHYIADACAHHAAYGSGVVGALGLCGWIAYKRISMASH